ncbi:MAG: hypothetical protein WBA16_00800 [Nonlabens sp.]
MRNFIVLILLLFVSLIARSQNPRGSVIVTLGAEREILPDSNDTLREYYEDRNLKKLKFWRGDSLIIKELRSTGLLKEILRFPKTDLKNKSLTKFNDKGIIILQASYVNGIVDGAFSKYHRDGKLKEQGTYKMMRKNGVWKYYDQKGMLQRTETYQNGSMTRD